MIGSMIEIVYKGRTVVIRSVGGGRYQAFQNKVQWKEPRLLGDISGESIDDVIAEAKEFIDGMPKADARRR